LIVLASLVTIIMATYRDTDAEWINIDSDDSDYDSGPDLVEPPSPTISPIDESPDEFEIVELFDIEVS
jgi:hypothetical protein